MVNKAWENRAAAKKLKLRNAIPAKWRLANPNQVAPADTKNVTDIPRHYLTDDELLITASSAATLLENVRSGVWSSVEVTNAFCHRAAIAHQLVNCLTEILFEDALRSAEELDTLMSVTGHTKGPLHGLPISFMDRYRIAGSETASGYIAWLGNTESFETETLMVRTMRELGAIPFCKTNVPMSMMLGETDNNIMGPTSNPFVRRLSSGGAAGGEGALIAMGGSCVGWVSEIAGSARIPAAFSSLYALKPSFGRLPSTGLARTIPPAPICEVTPALICTDVVTLKTICKGVLNKLPVNQDIQLLDIPWRENRFAEFDLNRPLGRKPKFGVLFCDGHVRPHPPIRRALNETVTVLRRAGFQIDQWSPPAHEPAVRILFQLLGADGLVGVREVLGKSGEPPVPQLREWYQQKEAGSMTVSEFWNLCQKRTDYQVQYQDYWNTTDVDAVIMPVAPSACAERGTLTYFGYTAIANLLDYSAGAFPFGFVDSQIDVCVQDEAFLNEEDEKVGTTYDPMLFHGAPIGLQIMCRRLEEEKVIALLEIIKMALSVEHDDWGFGAVPHNI